MANERTYPCLPCGNLDQAIAFYQMLGFTRVYRQIAPNPYAVVALEDLSIHLFGISNFNPAESYGSVIVVVPDVDALYQAFAAGLRAAYGKLPSVGYPRITRPRKKFGTVRGFSLVDVGGNWLRISKAGDTEEEAAAEPTAGLAKVLTVAARLGDAHGDEALALKTLETGLKRFPDAPVIDHARALLYRAELAIRLDKSALARSSLAAVRALTMTRQQKSLIAQELVQTSDLVAGDVATDGVSADVIRDTERQRLRALVEAEIAVANSLHSDDYQLITPGGRTMSKQDYVGAIAAGDLVYHVFEPASEIDVRLLGNAAAVRYQARIETRFSDQHDSGLFWHTDIYETRDGRWQVVWSQATRIRTPVG